MPKPVTTNNLQWEKPKNGSSHIHSYSYRLAGARAGDLYVKFLNGSIYIYHNVPYYLYATMMNASSKGKFLAAEIKGNFKYDRITF